MRRLAVLCCLFAMTACLKRAPDGTVLRRIPTCEKQGKSVRARPFDEAVQQCLRLLSIAPEDSSRTLLGLSTNESGKIADICLVGSTHDADSRFLNCVADQLLAAPAVLPANEKYLVWTLNVSF